MNLKKRIVNWNDFQLFEQIYKDLEDEDKKISAEAFRKMRSSSFLVIGNYPFFRSVLSNLIIRENRNLPYKTMATDGVSIHYDPDFVLSESMESLVWTIIHEVMHNVLKHFERKQAENDPSLWNVACDYALNPLITTNKSNKSLPPNKEDYPEGVLYPGCGYYRGDEKFENLTAEQIYSIISKLPKPGDSPPPPPPPPPPPNPLLIGDIVYDEKTEEYGIVTSFDESTGEVVIDPIDKKDLRNEVKRQHEEIYGK